MMTDIHKDDYVEVAVVGCGSQPLPQKFGGRLLVALLDPDTMLWTQIEAWLTPEQVAQALEYREEDHA